MSAHVWTFHEPPEARWRHYRCDGETHTPPCDEHPSGLKIASVTQILGALSKDALAPWAANVTAEGCWNLARYKTPYRRCRSCYGVGLDDECRKTTKDGVCGAPTWPYRVPSRGWRYFQKDLKSAALDHNSVTAEAAFRGTAVHKLHEDFAREGKIPNPADFPEAWRGYLKAYVAWLLSMQAAGAVFAATERIVGSVTYGFAGRCDEIAVIEGKDGRRERLDFKTSKQVYARTHFRQLGAYELADVEMGNPPTDDMGIVVLHEDGSFETVYVSDIEWPTSPQESFLNALRVWRDDQPLKKHEDAMYKARKAREKERKG